MTSTLKDSLTSQGILQGTSSKPAAQEVKSPFEGLRKLATDPKFQSLPLSEKMKVKGQLFDKYLVPYYKSKGMEATSNLKEHFVRSEDPTYKGKEVKLLSKEPDVIDKGTDFLAHMGMQAGKQGVKVVHGMVDAADKAEKLLIRPGSTPEQHALASTTRAGVRGYNIVENILKHPENEIDPASVSKSFDTWFQREQGFNKRTLDRKEDEFNTYLGSNYQNSFAVKAAEVPVRATGSVTAMFARSPEYLAAPGATGIGAEGILGKAALTDLLANGTLVEKMAYKAIKGAADGYLIGASEGQTGDELHGTAIFFSALEGAGPAVSKIAKPVFEAGKDIARSSLESVKKFGGDSADGAIAFMSKLLAWGGPSRVEQAIKAVDKSTPEEIAKADPTKITGAVVKATALMRDEVAQKLGYKDYSAAKATGKSAQGKVAAGVAAIVKQANAEIAVHNPEVVHLKATKDVKEWISNPLGAKLASQLQQMGINPIEATTETVVKNTRVAAGSIDKEKKAILKAIGISLDKGFESTLFEADKKALDKASKKSVFTGLGPGAASINEPAVLGNLIKLVETNIPMQSKTHTLTFMWSIEKNLPQEARGALAQIMKDIYGPNVKNWDKAAAKLDKHLDMMIKSGHVGGADKRGVFHSTKLSGEPTKWQGQLEDEVEQIRRRAEAETTSRIGENKVPVEKRASTIIKKEEAEKTARRIEGRTESKKQLEAAPTVTSSIPGVSEAMKTKGKHFDINKEAERLAKEELGPSYASDITKFAKRANEIKEELIRKAKKK